MQFHNIGIKQLDAIPMTRGDYNKFRGWTLPAKENAKDNGYMVIYSDGYISWFSKAVFETVYRPMKNLKGDTLISNNKEIKYFEEWYKEQEENHDPVRL